jgi:hypothetical protein
MVTKYEITKTKIDMSRIGFWASFCFDMFKGDKKLIEQRLRLICNERFINPEQCEPIIKELMGRI